ncbi:hypothetical protein HYS54_02010 [Candidatus Micrarchaeota archaeon]|nr:hypothetical protein [Candidatus Micrarchaeota archaeon]
MNKAIWAPLALALVVALAGCAAAGVQNNTSVTGEAAGPLKETEPEAPPHEEPASSSIPVGSPSKESKEAELGFDGPREISLYSEESYVCRSKEYGNVMLWFDSTELIFDDGYARMHLIPAGGDASALVVGWWLASEDNSDIVGGFRTGWKRSAGDGSITIDVKEIVKDPDTRMNGSVMMPNSNRVRVVFDCNGKKFPEKRESTSLYRNGKVACKDYSIALADAGIEEYLRRAEKATMTVTGPDGESETRTMLDGDALYFLDGSVFVWVRKVLPNPPFVTIEYAC